MTARRILLALLLGLASAPPARALVAEISQREIAVTTGFTGAELLVFGAKDSVPVDVIVTVRGPVTPVVVRQRTRIAGIWLTSASATFETAPGFYALASTRPLADLLPEAERMRLRLGLDALPLRAEGPRASPEFREALIGLKSASGLYRQDERAVAVTGERLFIARVFLPPTVVPGPYRVEVLGVQDRRIVAARDIGLTVRRVGTSADIWRFAHDHPWLYGFAAVLAAALVGWAGSVLFRRG
ncbi:MAG: TIGR02186 family protein [Acetobacteraceae bacterium]